MIVILLFLFNNIADESEYMFGINNTAYGGFQGVENRIYRNNFKRAIDSASSLGVKWIRVQNKFRWPDIQPFEGKWDFSNEDSIIKWVQQKDIQILPVIGYTAGWARNKNIPQKYSNYYPPDSSRWIEYKMYVKKLVERYDGDGIEDFSGLKIPIDNWEFMNEPNGAYFMGSPEDYRNWYDSTRKAMKIADRNAKLGGPCLKSTPDSLKWICFNFEKNDLSVCTTLTWIDMEKYLIKLIGMENLDFITHHLYRWPPEKNIIELDKLETLVNSLGNNKKEIWITELGKNWIDMIKFSGTEIYTGDSLLILEYPYKLGKIYYDIIDTLLIYEDTIFFEGKYPFKYTGGDIVIPHTKDTIKIGDTISIYHSYCKHVVSSKKDQINSQAEFYSKILENLKSREYLKRIKIFFFCLQAIDYSKKSILIKRGNRYLFSIKEAHAKYSILDKNFSHLPAFNTIKNKIEFFKK